MFEWKITSPSCNPWSYFSYLDNISFPHPHYHLGNTGHGILTRLASNLEFSTNSLKSIHIHTFKEQKKRQPHFMSMAISCVLWLWLYWKDQLSVVCSNNGTWSSHEKTLIVNTTFLNELISLIGLLLIWRHYF